MNNNIFKLSFPDDWRETTVYTFEGPFDSGVQHNLVLTINSSVPKDISLKDYAKGQCETNARLLPGFEYVDEKELISASGTAVYEITFRYVPANDSIFFQKQWCMFIDKKAYIFSSTFNKKTMNTIANDVYEIIESLEVEEN